MKKFILVLSVAMAIFACKPTNPVNSNTCLPDGWQPLDTARIKSYFFDSNRQSVVYISQNGKNMILPKDTYDCDYTNTFCDKSDYDPDPDGGASSGVPYEDFSIYSRYYDLEKQINLQISSSLDQRLSLNFKFKFQGYLGSFRVEMENDPQQSQGIGWPKNPEEYKTHLTDTIQLKNSGIVVGELVAGRGLIWFTDKDGVKWTLQE